MLKLISVNVTAIIILYTLLTVLIRFINKNDDTTIKDKISVRIIVSFFGGLAIGVLFVKYLLFMQQFLRCSVLMIYVILVGYIDYYTQCVYSFISHIFLGLSLVFLGIDLFYYGDIRVTIIGVAGSFIVSAILALIKIPGCGQILGWGDVEVITIAAIYIGGFTSVLNIFLSFSIAGMGAIFRIIRIRKLNSLKAKGALCPFIAASTFIILLCM